MNAFFRMRVCLAAVSGLALAACAGLGPTAGGEGSVARAPAPDTPSQAAAPAHAGPVGGPAVVALLDQADAERRQGDLQRADAALARALRIAPRNPWIWSRMAELRLAQGDPGQAEALALKSNSLADAAPGLRARNWTVVEGSRRLRGDRPGARQAARHAAALRAPAR